MYGYKKKVKLSFEATEQKVREALQSEGFGVLTEINVKETLKKKLDVNFDKYVILGACNPPFAYKALQTEKDIGLMLPCNVIVYEDKGSTIISAILPSVAMEMIKNEKLQKIAEEIEAKLKKVIDQVGTK